MKNNNFRFVTNFKNPILYDVILLNDPNTTMEFVEKVLRDIFGKNHRQAVKLTQKIHEKGYGVVGSYIYEIAGQKELETSLMAINENFPLKAVVKIR
jgi:ATP-dependent Clp protease adaptor protein ClpS|tara:strand:+ start:235 stop:525 length:291 start_codon:yes stop_codon:yes gene_type:complete